MEIKIIGFKEVRGKEDDIYYHPLDIKEFMRGNILYDKKIKYANTFGIIDSLLSNSDITKVDKNSLSLQDFNCKDNEIKEDDEFFNGIINAGIINITLDNSIFKNMYLLHLNKLNMITHYRVRSNFIIQKYIKDNVYDVML